MRRLDALHGPCTLHPTPFGHVLATLDGLWDERREERYRAAPLLRRVVATGESIS